MFTCYVLRSQLLFIEWFLPSLACNQVKLCYCNTITLLINHKLLPPQYYVTCELSLDWIWYELWHVPMSFRQCVQISIIGRKLKLCQLVFRLTWNNWVFNLTIYLRILGYLNIMALWLVRWRTLQIINTQVAFRFMYISTRVLSLIHSLQNLTHFLIYD